MSVSRFLLFPFAWLYDAITALRNRLFDMNYKPTVRFDIPVIGVGNLAVGGTGKTPMVEYLVRLLATEYTVATLSRGYGRKTKGFRIANADDTAATIGDEPFQLYRKYAPQVHVAVGEERAYAIPLLLQELNEVNTIILDDAFQHRSVTPGFNILLTEHGNPFFNDYLLPVGRLREAKAGAQRAHAIVVTKCPPHLPEDDRMEFEKRIRVYADAPVFFAGIRYGQPVSIGKQNVPFTSKIILVSAIANAHILVEHVRKSYSLLKHFSYRDHYAFTASDLAAWEKELQQHPAGEVIVLTTEKDSMKLVRKELAAQFGKLPVFYLPIETEFVRNGKDFDAMVQSFMQSFKAE